MADALSSFEKEQQSPYNKPSTHFETEKTTMCEFNVLLNGKSQATDVVYAKSDGNTVTVKSILGETKEFKNCRILEVDVNHERLTLESIKP
jgi:predicted RNA-binding protein